jgi:LmbE family N-acetylglucosaminyl deacetylase
MIHLFLSPHLDDAVLSCGAILARLARLHDGRTNTSEAARAVVLTLTAADPPVPLPATPLVAELHQRWEAGMNPVAVRRTEDRAALSRLGAEARYPDGTAWLDCIYRVANGEALYPTGEAIFSPPHVADTWPLDLAALDLAHLLDGAPISQIYAPLGVGRHVDHVLVRDWAVQLSERYPVCFYEEYPYLREAGAVEDALSYFWAQGLSLEPRVNWVSEDEVALKCEALACYQSQLSTFWADGAAMRADVRTTMLAQGRTVLAERLWWEG